MDTLKPFPVGEKGISCTVCGKTFDPNEIAYAANYDRVRAGRGVCADDCEPAPTPDELAPLAEVSEPAPTKRKKGI